MNMEFTQENTVRIKRANIKKTAESTITLAENQATDSITMRDEKATITSAYVRDGKFIMKVKNPRGLITMERCVKKIDAADYIEWEMTLKLDKDGSEVKAKTFYKRESATPEF